MMRAWTLLLVSACGLAIGCVRSSTSTTQATPAPPAPPAVIAETPSSPQPAPASDVPPTSIPAHGLASLELACELIVMTTLTSSPYGSDGYLCDPKNGVLAEDGRAGLLTAEGWVDYDFPIIATEAGWSVFPPVLAHWDTGNDINQERVAVSFQPWSSTFHGELLVIDIEAVSIDHDYGTDIEDRHWRKIFCAPGGATPRCTAAIHYRSAQARLDAGSRHMMGAYEAKLSIDGDDLVVEGKQPPSSWWPVDGFGSFLEPGRHSLEQLLATGEEAWDS